MSKHVHSFSVDAACDCGVMISDLLTLNGDLIAALDEARLKLEYLDRFVPTGTSAAVLVRIGNVLYKAQKGQRKL